MTPIERQILLNQVKIMELLRGLYPKEHFSLGGGEEDIEICKTLEFLNPKGSNEPCCKMEEDVKGCRKKLLVGKCGDFGIGENRMFCEECVKSREGE